MADPNQEFARYIEQRLEMGEQRLFMEERIELETPTVNADERKFREAASETRRSPSDLVGVPKRPKWLEGAPEIPPPGITIAPPETHLFEANPLRDLDLESLGEMVRACERCGLCKARTHAVPGEGPVDAKLMVIGEGPGATEDETGRPFVGRAGQLLNDILEAIECPRDTVFIGNVVKCRPPNNRDPEAGEIEQCLPYLNRQIELIHPSVILAMGRTAASTLLNTRGSLGSLRNRVHTYRGTPLIVTYHPAALLRNPQWKKPTWDDVRIARRILAGEQ